MAQRCRSVRRSAPSRSRRPARCTSRQALRRRYRGRQRDGRPHGRPAGCGCRRRRRRGARRQHVAQLVRARLRRSRRSWLSPPQASPPPRLGLIAAGAAWCANGAPARRRRRHPTRDSARRLAGPSSPARPANPFRLPQPRPDARSTGRPVSLLVVLVVFPRFPTTSPLAAECVRRVPRAFACRSIPVGPFSGLTTAHDWRGAACCRARVGAIRSA